MLVSSAARPAARAREAAVHLLGVVAQAPAPQAVVALVVGPAGRRRVGVAAEVVVVVLRARSAVQVARPGADGSPRNSAVRNSTRWRRHRSVAYASSKATGRRCGSLG